MSSYSGAFAVHKTLTAGSADTVTLTGGSTRVRVVNRSGTDDIYFVVGQPASTAASEAAGTGDIASGPTAPTVGANDTHVVPASIGSTEVTFQAPVTEVILISASAEKYSVIGLN